MQDRGARIPDSANSAANLGIQPDSNAPRDERPEYRAKLRRVIEVLCIVLIPRNVVLQARLEHRDPSCQLSKRDSLRAILFSFYPNQTDYRLNADSRTLVN